MTTLEELLKKHKLSKYALCKAIGGSYWQEKGKRPNLKMLKGWGATIKSTMVICNGIHKLTNARYKVELTRACSHPENKRWYNEVGGNKCLDCGETV